MPSASVINNFHEPTSGSGTMPMKEAWCRAWARPAFRWTLCLALLGAALIASLLPTYFTHLEARPGIVPWEPVLHGLPMADVSVVMFIVLYGSVIWSIVVLIGHPWRILRALLAYVIILLCRMASMWLVTLEPPPDLVPLIDPATVLFYPPGEPFTKDLFFSGHTASMTLLACAAVGPWMRAVLIMAAAGVAMLVLVQHVHWTIDVLAAPPVAIAAWWLAGRLVQEHDRTLNEEGA